MSEGTHRCSPHASVPRPWGFLGKPSVQALQFSPASATGDWALIAPLSVDGVGQGLTWRRPSTTGPWAGRLPSSACLCPPWAGGPLEGCYEDGLSRLGWLPLDTAPVPPRTRLGPSSTLLPAWAPADQVT